VGVNPHCFFIFIFAAKMSLKKGILVVIFTLSCVFGTQAQVTTNPVCFTADESITIIYDATQGTSGLVGASKVYMHSGVITDSQTGTSWQNVVGNWGADDGIGQMSKVSGTTDKWEITLTPRSYFSVNPSTTVYRLAMVFRNADGSKEGKNDANADIFIDLATDAVNLQITSTNPLLVDNGDIIPLTATTCSNAIFNLYIDNILEDTQSGTNQYSYNYQVTQAAGSLVQARLTAEVGVDTNEQVFSFSVRTSTVSAPRPAGIVEGINYDAADPTEVTLSLLAPLKSSVYVIGDFNNWQILPSYQMKKDGEYFWLEVTSLTPTKEYVFQYLVDETIRVADPYTDKVSDPWDDQYIDQATYPNLIKYPQDFTNFRASVLQTGQQPYNWVNTSFTPAAKEDLVVYELLVRDFDDLHTYKAVKSRLDYLENLGINAIHIMPTNEFEGNISWGYNPNFYFAPDKYYGTKNDFKALIDECHSRGIAVIIDVVLNHSYNSSPMVRMYWNTGANRPAADNPWYNEVSNFENPDAQWGNDFNHESTYTRNFIDSVNTYWLREYKIDGFRFDFTKGFSNSFKSNATDNWGSKYDPARISNLKRMADVIWTEKSDAIVIFEHLSENSEETELANYGVLLWGNMSYDYNEMSMGYASGKSIAWGYYKARGWADNNLMAYMESHDEERQMFKNITFGNSLGSYDVKSKNTALQRSRAASAFFFTVPGPKLMWQFGEFGYDISIDEGGRTSVKPTKWEYLDDPNREQLFETYKELIGLRDKYKVFTTGNFTWQPSGNFKSIHIDNTDTSVVVIGNFDMSPTMMDPQFQHTGTWYDFFTSTELNVSDVNATIPLGPGEFRIYTDKKLHTPKQDIITGIEDSLIGDEVTVYPNPTKGHLNIRLDSNTRSRGTQSWRIVDVFGKEVLSGSSPSGSEITLDVSLLPRGMYTFMLAGRAHPNYVKFIKE
jgi:1,4-alpha-glucan branching enzyme